MHAPFLLFIVFLVLRLTEVIAWSWWWVTAPLWISAGIGLVVFCLGLLLVYTAGNKYERPRW